jgi:hypothetical protein
MAHPAINMTVTTYIEYAFPIRAVFPRRVERHKRNVVHDLKALKAMDDTPPAGNFTAIAKP